MRRPFRGFNHLGALVVLLHLEREVFLKLIVDPQFARLFIFFCRLFTLVLGLVISRDSFLRQRACLLYFRNLGAQHLALLFLGVCYKLVRLLDSSVALRNKFVGFFSLISNTAAACQHGRHQ